MAFLSSMENIQIQKSLVLYFSRNSSHGSPSRDNAISSPYTSWSCFAISTASSLKRDAYVIWMVTFNPFSCASLCCVLKISRDSVKRALSPMSSSFPCPVTVAEYSGTISGLWIRFKINWSIFFLLNFYISFIFMEKMPGASSPAYLKNLYCTLKNAAFAFF